MSMDIIHQTINNQTALDDFLFVHDDLLLGLSCIPPIFWGVPPQKKSGTSPRKKQTITPIQKPPQSCWNGNSLIRLSAEPSVKSPDSMGFLWLGTWRPSDKTQKSTKIPSLPKSKSKSPVFLFRNSRRAWVKYVKSFKIPLSLFPMIFHYIYNHIVILRTYIYISHTFTFCMY